MRLNGYKANKTKSPPRVFFVAAFSSLLAALSQPSFFFQNGCALLAWIALTPLFIGIKAQKHSIRLALGLEFGLVYLIVSQYWLFSYHPAALFFAAFLFGLRFAILILLIGIALDRLGSFGPLSAAGLWALSEYLATRGFLGYEFGALAASQYRVPFLVHTASLYGIFGLSFFICLVNADFARLFEKAIDRTKKDLEPGLSRLSRLSAFTLGDAKLKIKLRREDFLPLLGGGLALAILIVAADLNPRSDKTIKIALIQPDIRVEQRGIDDYRQAIIRLRALTQEALEKKPDLIVWHETAIVPSINWHRTIRDNSALWSLLENIDSYMADLGVPIVFGNSLAELQTGPVSAGRIDRNAAILKFGRMENAYTKSKLVPFAETFPLGEKFPSLGAFVERITGPAWSAGKGPILLQLPPVDERPAIPFGTPICFEDGFGDYCAAFAKSGAGFLVVITNDAWARSLAAQNQHAALSAFRSSESGLALARAASTGTTAAFLPDGNILGELPAFTQGVLIVDIPWKASADAASTLYLSYGDYPVMLIGFASLFAVLIAWFFRRNGSRKTNPSH